MDRKDLVKEILGYIDARSDWESNQSIWYQMRHDGLGRANPPWPGAANLHFPLGDTQITKFKPFYHKQIFGNELLATFIPKKKEEAELARIAEQWFNYKLRYQSNLFKQSQIFIDSHLQCGHVYVKTIWDSKKKRVKFIAVDCMSIITSPNIEDTQSSDKFTHVIKLSVDAYKRRKDYNQDEDFIKRIKGSVTDNEADKQQLTQLKKMREGFATTCDPDQIILWETWCKDENDKYIVYTYSPKDCETDIKAPYENPYDHGLLPFSLLEFEIKDSSPYSSRGAIETVAMEETYLTKIMNEKYDAMTLLNRPIYTVVGNPLPNMENMLIKPGACLPNEIRAIQNPPPPIDFDNETMMIRQNAEQRIGSPDFGINQVNQQGMQEKPTATQVNAITGLANIAIDLRGDIFRHFTTDIFQQAYALLLQYDDSLDYYFREEMDQANPEAIKDKYLIMPSGTVDSYNKSAQVGQAMQLQQMYQGNPFIRQDQLVKNTLEKIDPRLINQLYQAPQEANANQAEDQASECLLIEQGFPAQVKNTDDHPTHIQTATGRLQMLAHTGVRLNPIAVKLYLMHVKDHLFMYKAQKGAQAPQAKAMEDQFMQAIAPFMPQQPQQAQSAPQGQPAMPQQGGQNVPQMVQ